MTEIPIFQAKNQLARIVHEAETGDSIRLTRHGKPAAMLMGMAEYERIRGSGTGLAAALDRWRRDWPMETASLEEGSVGQDHDAFAGLRSADPGHPFELWR